MEHPLAHLENYLPAGSLEGLRPYFRTYPIQLTITRSRRTVRGNYCPPAKPGEAHRITINTDLNPYGFLVTLTHEIAHLKAFVVYGNTIKPHGIQWKEAFRSVLQPFVMAGIFPPVLVVALDNYLKNPAASSCSDVGLATALRQFDTQKKGVLVSSLPDGTTFKIAGGRQFIRIKMRRTRIECKEIATGKIYTFSATAETEV